MKRYTLVYLGILVLLCLSFSSATPLISGDFGTYRINQSVTLTQDCEGSGSINISLLFYPNGTLAIPTEIPMAPNDGLFVAVFNQTQIPGIYQVYGHCGVGPQLEVWSFTFEVNGLGKEVKQRDILFYGLIFLMQLLGIVGLGYSLNRIPTRNPQNESGRVISISWLKYLRPVCYGLIYLLIWSILYYFGALAIGFLPESSFGDLMLKSAFFMMSMAIPAIIIYFLVIIQEVLQDAKIKRLMERGLELDDDEY